MLYFPLRKISDQFVRVYNYWLILPGNSWSKQTLPSNDKKTSIRKTKTLNLSMAGYML